MNDSEPVPPQLPTCPNCGASMPDAQSYCPRCGYSRLRPGRPPKSNSCLQVLLIVVFVGIALPIAAAGACFLLVAQGDQSSIAIGIGALLLAILIVVLMVRAVMKS